MGKEAKIGLAVILVLLITFGVVLARRLTGSKVDPNAVASEKNSQTEGKEKGKLPAVDGKLPTPSGGVGNPTLVGAGRRNNASTSGTGLPKPTPGTAMPPWRMPEPLLPDTGDLNAQHPKREQTNDPFQGRGSNAGLGNTAPISGGSNTLREVPPPLAAPAQTAAGSGNASAGSSLPPGQALQVPVVQRPLTPSPTTSMPSTQQQQISMSTSKPPLGSPYGTGNLRNDNGEYEVQPNDSYWVISEKLYGHGGYFKALAEHNRERVSRADQLDVGDVLLAPGLSELEKAHPGLCPKPSRGEILRKRASAVSTVSGYVGGRSYVVQEGDTLFDIARYELGKASRWPEILEMNRSVLGDDPNYLSPGIRLALPVDEPVERVTDRPGTGSTLR